MSYNIVKDSCFKKIETLQRLFVRVAFAFEFISRKVKRKNEKGYN